MLESVRGREGGRCGGEDAPPPLLLSPPQPLSSPLGPRPLTPDSFICGLCAHPPSEGDEEETASVGGGGGGRVTIP